MMLDSDFSESQLRSVEKWIFAGFGILNILLGYRLNNLICEFPPH